MSALPIYRPIVIGNDLNHLSLFFFFFPFFLVLEIMKSPLHTQSLSGYENRFWELVPI